MKSCRDAKVFDMLGMARRAGVLVIGQDKVLQRLKKDEKLAIFITPDCSAAVKSRVESAERCEKAEIFLLENCSRSELGAKIGIVSTQIAALPAESGFAKKIYTLICDRSDADE